jgi:hypothetical protein
MSKHSASQRKRRLVLIATSSVGLLSAVSAYSADMPKKTTPVPDINFLEYLGSLETKDDNWTDALNADAVTTESADDQSSKQPTKTAPKAKKPEAATAMAESK